MQIIQWGLNAAIVGGRLLKIGCTLGFPAIFFENVGVRMLDKENSDAWPYNVSVKLEADLIISST